jgi:hypothetical protein
VEANDPAVDLPALREAIAALARRWDHFDTINVALLVGRIVWPAI